MTYAQAMALIQQQYGTTAPYSIGVTNPQLQTFLSANNVPGDIKTQIGYAYYTAQRTSSTIDSVLTSRGYLTPTTTATTTPTTTTTTIPTTTAIPTTTTADAGTITPITYPSYTTSTGTSSPTIEVPTFSLPSIFTQPSTTQTEVTVPTIDVNAPSGSLSPSALASQTTTVSQTTAPVPLTLYNGSTATIPRQVVSDGVTLLYDGSTWVGVNPKGQQVNLYPEDLQRILSNGTGMFTGNVLTISSPSIGTQPTSTTNLPSPTQSTISVPTMTNPITQPATTISTTAPVISVPPISTAPVTTTPTMGGSVEDQINYQSAIRRLTKQLGLSKEAANQQSAELRAQYESQIRKAMRERYFSQAKAIASLGARGISGAPGLSIAARRAGGAEADYKRLTLIGDRNRQLSALQRTLTQQLADYEEELRRNQEQLTRATQLSNQLTGTATNG